VTAGCHRVITSQAPRGRSTASPGYPALAQASRISGEVRVEATIEATGCVAEARVVQSVHPFLDESAIRAVTRWRFTPTLVDGAPVSAIMTVTANFSLQ
jgi:protein TonB